MEHADPSVALVDVSLDAAQRRAVELAPGNALLVLGEAGHGKTTVAIHRLAHLARQARGRFRAAVVVPSEGLRRLIERALVRLGVDVPAMTFERFARMQARRAFAGLPRRESGDATPAVIRLKRDPALEGAIGVIAGRGMGVIDDALDGEASPRADLQQLFGDRNLVRRVVAESGGRLPAHTVEEVLEHTRVQFGVTSEEAWAHVDDRARLVPVDRRSLDAGTPDADAGSIDVEDYAVLFAIDLARANLTRLRPADLTRLRPKRPRAFDCLVLDEAQELAPLELALLGRSLAKGASLVVAGDADQQLDDAASFAGWDATLRALGRPTHDRVTLDIGYRCPPAIVALARAVRDATPPPAIDLTRYPSEPDLAHALAAQLESLLDADPRARIALITRAPLPARRLAAAIRATLPARLVLDGAFRFAPGIDVTTVDQVRGLEVDHVVVPDASSATYPADSASRRALYVAITRARRSARFACVGDPSQILA